MQHLDTDTLIAQRNRAAAAYYNTGEPVMTDDAFDALTAELTRRGVAELVGHGAPGGKVAHIRPMLSLKKVHTAAQVAAWAESINGAIIIEPKYDGLAASLIFDSDGRLIRAVTRGDGEKGDTITRHVLGMLTRDNPAGGTIEADAAAAEEREIRGEIIITREDFRELNRVREHAGESRYANRRNAAAGMVGRHDHSEAAAWLTFIQYDSDWLVEGAENSYSLCVTDPKFEHLVPFGTAHPRSLDDSAIEQILADAEGFLMEMTDPEDFEVEFPVDTDGVVFKAFEREDRDRLGESSTAPRWAVAYKFPNRPKQTVLRAVEWAETRTGRVVPTAVFDPVELSGATVSRATLNNVAFLEELDVWIGDTIEVTRANEVIPNVVRRIGEHAASSTPVLDPNGWPVGAGTLTAISRTNSRRIAVVVDPRPKSDDDIKLVTIFEGNPEHRLEVEDEDYYEHVAFLANPDGGDDIEASFYNAFDHDEFATAAMSFMWHRQMKNQVDLLYRREGRDLVHDGGRDVVKDISFAASKLDILGLGEDVVRRLVEGNPQIDSFPALLEACREGTLMPFERGTQKLVTKLESEVIAKTSGPQDPAKWIAAAGVPMVGVRAGKKLCRFMAFPSGISLPPASDVNPFRVLASQTEGSIQTIDGFGPSNVAQILAAVDVWEQWADEADNLLFAWGPYFPHHTAPEAAAAATPLTGKRVLVTGTLPTLSRKQAEERIEQLGGTVASSVSKTLDLLVAGEKAGSKLDKAQALGVEVMGAAEFESLALPRSS